MKAVGMRQARSVFLVTLAILLCILASPASAQGTYQKGPDYQFSNFTYEAAGTQHTVRLDWNIYGGPTDLPYYIHNDVIAAGYEPAVRSAFETIEADTGSDISFTYMGATSRLSELTGTMTQPEDGTNVVSFGQVSAGSIGPGGFGGIFYTNADGSPNFTGEGQFDITLSSSAALAVGAQAGTIDVESLVLHELGHVLGLQHPTTNTDAVMWDTLIEGELKRDLHPADSAGLAVLYPAPAVPGLTPFNDVPGDAYFHDAVVWAAAEGITNGTSPTTFGPNDRVTRAQMATFLYRYNLSPVVGTGHPFVDVPGGAYFDVPVAWMVQEEITTGTSPTTFSPFQTVTRAQMAAFLWRSEGRPTALPHSFGDVPGGSYYDVAVAWMSQNDITTGTSASTFSPLRPLTRAHAVTFLYRLAGSPPLPPL